jgi:tRNA dimethylallyltransferase
VVNIGIDISREELYSRIDMRVDKMLEQGLEDEARSVYPFKQLSCLNTVGYQEFSTTLIA